MLTESAADAYLHAYPLTGQQSDYAERLILHHPDSDLFKVSSAAM